MRKFYDQESVIKSFDQKHRSLLRDVSVQEEGRIRVDTTNGAPVTADIVLETLKQRDERKEKARSKKKSNSVVEDNDVKEGAEALRRYAPLEDQRRELRKRLRESRQLRLDFRRVRFRPAHLGRAAALEQDEALARESGFTDGN